MGGSATEPDSPGDSPEQQASDSPDPPANHQQLSPTLLSPTLSFTNGDIYEALDDDWLTASETGELSLFAFLDNFNFLPETLDKLNQRLKRESRELRAKLKYRIPSQYRTERTKLDQNLEKLRQTVTRSITTLQVTWNDGNNVSMRDKIAFVSAVGNIFITALLLGMAPEKLPIWYTGQMIYYMPLRYFSYKNKGYHYFIADLCYWVNLLLVLFLWVFPQSDFLLIATYCLANGPVAWAIIAWRNSLVFHIVSLFIHIMPPVVLHTILHLMPQEYALERYPALKSVPYLGVWRGFWISSVVHTLWQLWYYFFIMVRRKEKIAAGRPTSFTWLRRSYAKTWIGKWVNGFPEPFPQFIFMLIQYSYSLLTLSPCPIWYSSKVWSAVFVSIVFGWSVWNGATYYVDIFGNRFQKELKDLRRQVEKWQNSPLGGSSGAATPSREIPSLDLNTQDNSKED